MAVVMTYATLGNLLDSSSSLSLLGLAETSATTSAEADVSTSDGGQLTIAVTSSATWQAGDVLLIKGYRAYSSASPKTFETLPSYEQRVLLTSASAIFATVLELMTGYWKITVQNFSLFNRNTVTLTLDTVTGFTYGHSIDP